MLGSEDPAPQPKTEIRLISINTGVVGVFHPPLPPKSLFYVYIAYKGKTFFNKRYWVYALKFNIPLIPHYLSMIILNQSDRIMIANICGESQAAIYGVAYNVAKVGVVINSAITASFTPWIYEKLKSQKCESCSKVSISLFVFVAAVAIGIMLLGPEVIYIFATKEYLEAIYVIPPIAASVYFIFVYNQVSTVEFFYGKSKYIMVASLVGAGLNIILNYVAIKRFGYIAAAYTTLICYVFFSICHFTLADILRRKNNIQRELFPKKWLIILSCAVIIFSLLINFAYLNCFIRYSLMAALATIIVMKRNKIVFVIKSLKL